MGRGDAIAATGKYADAVPDYMTAIKLAPGLAEAHHHLAVALLHLGMPGAAAEEAGIALKLRPGSAEIKDVLKIARAHMKKPKKGN